MGDIIKPILDKVIKMDQKTRMLRLCDLATKDHLNTASPEEFFELTAIQAFRELNGELENKVWDKTN